MAALHPDLQDLLEDILVTPMAWLAREAIDQILSDENAAIFERDSSSPQADLARLRRQAKIATEVIVGTLKNETDATQRLSKIAPEIGIDSIVVTAAEAEDAVERPADKLLAPEREQAIVALIDAWQRAVGTFFEGPDEIYE